MNRTVALIILVVGAIGLALGLAFMCAATADADWWLIALIVFALGAGLTAWGAVSLRRLRELDPKVVADRITEQAKTHSGEVTVSEAIAELGVPNAAARAAFNLLERDGQAHREMRGEKEVYVFPGFTPSVAKRKCPYCGAEFSVKTALYKCPQCGGDLRVERQ